MSLTPGGGERRRGEKDEKSKEKVLMSFANLLMIIFSSLWLGNHKKTVLPVCYTPEPINNMTYFCRFVINKRLQTASRNNHAFESAQVELLEEIFWDASGADVIVHFSSRLIKKSVSKRDHIHFLQTN